MYYRVCELCGNHLKPSEHCDCEVKLKRNKKIRDRHYNNLSEYMKELEETDSERITV